jgi:hypothetical protein
MDKYLYVLMVVDEVADVVYVTREQAAHLEEVMSEQGGVEIPTQVIGPLVAGENMLAIEFSVTDIIDGWKY